MTCPRCNIGAIEGGTGCIVCKFCHSIFDLDGYYWYSFKTQRQRTFDIECKFSTEPPVGYRIMELKDLLKDEA